MSILAYGFPFSGDYPFTRGRDQLEERIYWLDFLVQKTGAFPPDREQVTSDLEFDRLHEDYLVARDQVLSDYGCEIEEAGYRVSPDYYVRVRLPVDPVDTELSFTCVEPVDLARMQQVSEDPELKNKLRRFCDVLGIEYKEPSWYLISWDTSDD